VRLNSELNAAIRSDGFAIVPDVVDSLALSRLAAILDQLRSPSAVSRKGSVYAVRSLFETVPQVLAVVNSTRILALVEQVLGPDCFPVKGTLFDKRPEANWIVPWHQDLFIAVQERISVEGFGPWSMKMGVQHVRAPTEILEGMLAVRLSVDDCGEYNGALRVIPGSHLHGRMGRQEVANWTRGAGSISCPVPKGSALMMRPLLLHASSSSIAPTRRRVIHLEFAARELPGSLRWCIPNGYVTQHTL
jgi:ectoine hydroxylase-related dioxygenase (phytanoyl-CoA dioxygenase family)